ncbi:hypothetical protein FQA47_025718 [Oryzias melastigma]|uniref:Uncharacterized protein n=1 Tax=Oryzias melastigma TaxID=30732 RepID=A0A834CMI2_ORYME|nr:hypothetical protein FQA47_025718 [Oryzias melastigma]
MRLRHPGIAPLMPQRLRWGRGGVRSAAHRLTGAALQPGMTHPEESQGGKKALLEGGWGCPKPPRMLFRWWEGLTFVPPIHSSHFLSAHLTPLYHPCSSSSLSLSLRESVYPSPHPSPSQCPLVFWT